MDFKESKEFYDTMQNPDNTFYCEGVGSPTCWLCWPCGMTVRWERLTLHTQTLSEGFLPLEVQLFLLYSHRVSKATRPTYGRPP